MKTFLLKLWRLLPKSYALRMCVVSLVTQKFLVGVAGVVFNQNHEVLLFHHSYRKEYPWGLPGGWLKKGEQPEQALQREIAEETGLAVRVIRPLRLDSDPAWAHLDLVYLCRFTGGEITPSDEVTSAAFFAPTALPPLLTVQAAIIREAAKVLLSD